MHHFGGKEGLVAAVEQTARVMREQPAACAYLGRALVEGTPGSARLFRLMIAGGRAEVEALAERGALREDVLDRWVGANVDLLEQGLYR